MDVELHSTLLLYTIHDDGARALFLDKIKGKFPQCTRIDESTYSLRKKEINETIGLVKSIYNECNSMTKEEDYVSVLCSAFLQNQTYKSKEEKDCIVEYHVVPNNS